MAIGTAVAIGAGIKLVGAVGSFQQAAQVKDLQETADRQATDYLQKASDTINKDYYAKLKVPMEAYDAELLSNLQATTTAVEALSEAGSRELIGGVGKLASVQAKANESARLMQQKELFALDKFKADAEDSMNQQQLALQVAGEQDKQKRDIEFQEQRASLQKQGISQLASMATTIAGGLDDQKLSKQDKQLKGLLEENNISAKLYAADPEKYSYIFDQPAITLKDTPLMTPKSGPQNAKYLTDDLLNTKAVPSRQQGPINEALKLNVNPSLFSPENSFMMPKPQGLLGLGLSGKGYQNPQSAFGNQGYMGFQLNQFLNPEDPAYSNLFGNNSSRMSMDELLIKYGIGK
tara:strand:- start:4913 stop:5959 length:1047 start_codon:yes stop_codon:yes gene_type:complete